MKKVMHPKTREIVIIDETKEPNRQRDYLHHTGKAFEWVEEVKEPVKKAVKKPSSRPTKKNVTRKS
jgi:hypothetical protein